jgi:hypothetical protein
MVVAVVAPVVFCNKATENLNQSTKTSCLYPIFVCITIYCKTYYNSLIASCSLDRAQVDGGQIPNHLGPMVPGILGITGKLLSL